MPGVTFDKFFQGDARLCLMQSIRAALLEDGPDLTSNAVFSPEDMRTAAIVAKEDSLLAGLPILNLVLEETAAFERGSWRVANMAADGDFVRCGACVARITGSAPLLLRAERVILNFICRLSGIANLTRKYVQALQGTGVGLLDTRKTAPGLRYPDKYAVLVGGGLNHRKNLAELLMLKDNHIEAAGGITLAVERLRSFYPSGPGIEVECRSPEEALESAACGVQRIMLDNMSRDMIHSTLDLLPKSVEVEISGGVDLANIRELAALGGKRKADFISVGRITHSALVADFSMKIGALAAVS
ncbi:MAG: carboxylating nicotinate-nucleotide diphosphorylase [Desulfovibrio sp.]|jgi:nicotinate-nucleotide pyrophosphorylase (carboxylating)|nr:carboxylating nicotinate-nucleotide diphosphorylase [Desulfovibrio sp.]